MKQLAKLPIGIIWFYNANDDGIQANTHTLIHISYTNNAEKYKQERNVLFPLDELSKQQLNIFLFVQSRLLHFVSSGWVFFLSISIFMRVVVACTFLAGLHLALRETVSGQDFFNFCLSFTPEPAE